MIEANIELIKLKEYVDEIHLLYAKKVDGKAIMDFAIEFIEKNDFCEEFIDCQFNPSIFYLYAKARLKEIPITKELIEKRGFKLKEEEVK